MDESAASMGSLRDILSLYINKKGETSLLQDLNASIEFLHQNPDFDSFDRAAFITRFENKISAGIAKLEQNLPGSKIKYNRILRQEVGTLFDSGAFNVNAFSPGPEFRI